MSRSTQPEKPGFGGHKFPPGWKMGKWLIPYLNGEAVIHHGHDDPDDHSMCGPLVFCCSKAQQLFLDIYPDHVGHQAEWKLTDGAYIAGWLDQGVRVIFFIFCDPGSSEGLFAGGLFDLEARQALQDLRNLAQQAHGASRLR